MLLPLPRAGALSLAPVCGLRSPRGAEPLLARRRPPAPPPRNNRTSRSPPPPLRARADVTDTAGERHYTCSSNAECASFLAAGVNVTDLNDNVDAAMNAYRIVRSPPISFANLTNVTVPTANNTINNTNVTIDGIVARRQLNYQGHVNADGSGSGCKVTKKGLHKVVTGGMGTPASPYAFRRASSGETCDYFTGGAHDHFAGEPCGTASIARRRQLRQSDGTSTDMKAYVLKRQAELAAQRQADTQKRQLSGSYDDMDTISVSASTSNMKIASRVLVCPEIAGAAMDEMGREEAELTQYWGNVGATIALYEQIGAGHLVDDWTNQVVLQIQQTSTLGQWNFIFGGGRRRLAGASEPAADGTAGRQLAGLEGTLCVKSLWNVYANVVKKVHAHLRRITKVECEVDQYSPHFLEENGWNTNGCQRSRTRTYMREIMLDMLLAYVYDTEEDTGLSTDEAVAEGIAVMMDWYDQCDARCTRRQIRSFPAHSHTPPPPAHGHSPHSHSPMAVSSTCASWCNAYTCYIMGSSSSGQIYVNQGYVECAGCSVCATLNTGNQCQDWCNEWTCNSADCEGCRVCNAQQHQGVCLSWCNRWTCGESMCADCNFC